LSMMSAMAAANTVPPSGLADIRRSITPDDLKPPQCAAIHVTNLIVGTGVFTGTAGNDLILGGPGADTIYGGSGDDCILGGGGDDQLYGGAGTDVCIGGGGSDILDPSCESQS